MIPLTVPVAVVDVDPVATPEISAPEQVTFSAIVSKEAVTKFFIEQFLENGLLGGVSISVPTQKSRRFASACGEMKTGIDGKQQIKCSKADIHRYEIGEAV